VASRSAAEQIRFDIRTHVLDNGLRVILQADHSVPVVAVHLMLRVGSKDEPPGRTGYAHLLEHLLFQGSLHVGETEHFRHVQSAGGTANGSTWFDRTNYYETLPANGLDLALWLESDRLGFFLPALTRTKLDNQREVVKNERRQSYENRPYGLAVETMLRTAYPEDHPYGHPTIGSVQDLDSATMDDVRSFFETYYMPSNAVLVLAGDFDPADALRRVDRFFGEIRGGAAPPEVEVPELQPGGRRAEIEDRVEASRLYMMFHAPAFPHAEFETCDVLTSLLAEGKSSRLYRDLVYETRVAGEVSAFTWPLEKTGMLWVVATARSGVTAGLLEEAVDETLDLLRRKGLTAIEMEGALNRSRRQLVRHLAGVSGRADALAHAAMLRDEPEYVNSVFDRYGAVEAADVEALAQTLLRPENGTVLRVVPRAGTPGARGAR
jgi:zinc protease